VSTEPADDSIAAVIVAVVVTVEREVLEGDATPWVRAEEEASFEEGVTTAEVVVRSGRRTGEAIRGRLPWIVTASAKPDVSIAS
jgi:hypothetical protein